MMHSTPGRNPNRKEGITGRTNQLHDNMNTAELKDKMTRNEQTSASRRKRRNRYHTDTQTKRVNEIRLKGADHGYMSKESGSDGER